MSIKLETETTPPAPPPNFVRFFLQGSSLKYIVDNGTVFTLSTGVTPEEVQDIVGAMIQEGAGIDVNYDDPLNIITISIDSVTLATINSALQNGDNVSGLVNDANYQNNTQVQASINAAIAGQILGDNYEDFEDLSVFSTTSNSFVTAYTFNTTNKQVGRYRLYFAYKYEPSATSDDDVFRLVIDGVADVWENFVEGKDTGSDQNVPGQIIKHIDFATEQTHTIELEVRQTDAGTTVVKGCRGEMWRVSP